MSFVRFVAAVSAAVALLAGGAAIAAVPASASVSPHCVNTGCR